jgi:hypothetical protein
VEGRRKARPYWMYSRCDKRSSATTTAARGTQGRRWGTGWDRARPSNDAPTCCNRSNPRCRLYRGCRRPDTGDRSSRPEPLGARSSPLSRMTHSRWGVRGGTPLAPTRRVAPWIPGA